MNDIETLKQKIIDDLSDIRDKDILEYLQMGGGKTDDADLAAGLRLVAKVSLVYI